MISDFTQGRLFQAAYKQKKGKRNVSEIARAVGVNRRTAAKYANARKELRKVKKKKRNNVPAYLRKRRAALLALSKEMVKKGHRVFPRYSTSEELRGALKGRGFDVPSARQIQRDLHAVGLHAFVRLKVPTRMMSDKRKRSAFAKQLKTWSKKDIRRIVFSDESWLSCCEQTGRMQWCATRKDVAPLERKARWNVASVMVFAAVGIGYKSPLIILPSKMTDEDGESRAYRLNADRYCQRCLQPIIKSLAGRVFMQDGARSHVAKKTQQYLANKAVKLLLGWPPYSPDWNPIERIWNELKRRVGLRCPMNQEELIKAAHEEWALIPPDVIRAHCMHFEHQIASEG